LKNRVYRSRKNRVIAGVAGGLGEYFDVDVVIVRILFVLAVFLGGGGLLAYIIAWIVIPEEKIAGEELDSSVEYYEEKNEWDPETRSKRQRDVGFLLIGLGVFFLSRRFLGSFFYYFGPLLLIIIGIFLLVRERRDG
jgi:phage shock protein C